MIVMEILIYHKIEVVDRRVIVIDDRLIQSSWLIIENLYRIYFVPYLSIFVNRKEYPKQKKKERKLLDILLKLLFDIELEVDDRDIDYRIMQFYS